MEAQVRFRWLKNTSARVLLHPVTGSIAGRIFRDRIPSRGCTIDTSSAVVPNDVKAMLLFRVYESAEQRFIMKYLRANLDVVELGSSLGVVTSQIGRRLQPGRRLVAVEANESLLGTLRRNIALNAPHVDASIVHAAIDYGSAAEVAFAVGDAPYLSRVASGVDSARASRVPALTLGALLRERGIDRFALVSDIEGAEAGWILNESEALGRCQQIVCELHATQHAGHRYSPEDLVRLLGERHGMRLVDHFGDVCVFGR